MKFSTVIFFLAVGIAAVLSCLIAAVFCKLLFLLLVKLDDLSVEALLTAAFSSFGLIGGCYSYFTIKRREIASVHRTQKIDAYRIFLNTILLHIKSLKHNPTATIDQVTDALIQSNMINWASEDSICAWNEFRDCESGRCPDQAIISFNKFINAMRKDLGHKDKKQTKNFTKFLWDRSEQFEKFFEENKS